MKKFIPFALFIILSAGGYVHAQAEQCPADKVCVSRAVAEKALADDATVRAQKAEIETLNKAIADYKDLLEKARIEFANVSGANSELRQNAVSDRAIIDLLLKSVRPKKIGLINF